MIIHARLKVPGEKANLYRLVRDWGHLFWVPHTELVDHGSGLIEIPDWLARRERIGEEHDMTAALGVMMAGGGDSDSREENDFYPTPPGPAEALLSSRWAPPAGSTVWECACGTGEMAEALKSFGYTVAPTDLIDRGYGMAPFDFTTMNTALADVVMTNPPFSLAEEFVRAAHRMGTRYLALLLKSTWFHADTRRPLLAELPPTAILPLTFRTDFKGLGRPTMELSWFVWRCWGERVEAYEALPWPADRLGPRRKRK